jgi:hypothetical protein
VSVVLANCPSPARCDEAQTCQGRCHQHTVAQKWTDTDPETGKLSHNNYAGPATAHDYQGATIDCAAHDARVTELLEANNREVERRRKAERCAEILREIVFGGGYRLAQYQQGREALEAMGITGPKE